MNTIEKLVGIRVRADLRQGPLNLQITDDGHDLTHRFGVGFDFKTNLRVLTSWQAHDGQQQPTQIVSSPIFFADDSDATTLGLLNKKPGYSVKPLENWRSIYMGAAPAPAAVWREIARYAGVQVLNEEADVLYPDQSWLALHTDKPGARRISLPFCALGVFEVFRKELVAGTVEQFSFEAERGKTYLFYLGRPPRLAELLHCPVLRKNLVCERNYSGREVRRPV